MSSLEQEPVAVLGSKFAFAEQCTLAVFRACNGAAAARAIAGTGIVWTKPALAAEITFRGWTHDEKLRHASFKGQRDKADELSVYRLV